MLAKAYVEITNFCGLNCDFCDPSKEAKKEMPLELFEKINSELQKRTKIIAYHMLGDPLGVNHLTKYLDISKKYGLEVELTTSGKYLCNIDKNTLLHPAIRQINFSLSAYKANSNFKISFEEYIGGIIDFIGYSASHPKRFINLRLWNIGDESYFEFNKKIEQSLCDRLCIFIDTELQKQRIAPYAMLVKDKIFEWPSLKKPVISSYGSCHAISSQLGFLVDGVCVPCCLDTKADIKLGDINSQTLSEILDSKRAQEMKNGFSKNILTEEMCKRCGFREARL